MKKTLALLVFLALNAANVFSQTAPPDAAKEDLRKTNAEVVRLYREKKFTEALTPARKAAGLAAQIFGKDGVETARAEANLGYVRLAQGDAKAAEDSFEKAVAIYKKNPALGKEDGAAFADVLETLGGLKYEKNIGSSADLFERALEWREKSGGAQSIKTATPLSRLASISYWQRDYKKAAAQLERLLDVVSKNRSVFGEDAALAFYRAECAFLKAGDEKKLEAMKYKYLTIFDFFAEAGKPVKDDQVVPSGVINGKALNLVKPSYPSEARDARAAGEVRVKVLIDQKGGVLHACSEKDDKPVHASLMEASEAAALQSKFSPTTVDGKPVRVTGVIVYRFAAR